MMFPAEIEALARDRQERMERELRREMLYRKARQNRMMPGRTGVGLLPRVGRLAVQFVFWPYIRPTIRRLGLWLQDVGRWMAGGAETEQGGRRQDIQHWRQIEIASRAMSIARNPANKEVVKEIICAPARQEC